MFSSRRDVAADSSMDEGLEVEPTPSPCLVQGADERLPLAACSWDWEASCPATGGWFHGVVRACRGSTRPHTSGRAGNCRCTASPPGSGWTTGLLVEHRGMARRTIECTQEGLFFGGGRRTCGSESGQRCSFSGRRRQSDGIERCWVSRGTEARARRGPGKRRSRREAVADTSWAPRSHTVGARHRVAVLRRPGDARRSRGESLCSKEGQPDSGGSHLRGRPSDDQRSCVTGS